MPDAGDALRLGDQPPGYRSGFVSIVGRPNVGKSTLLNQVLRRKVAITSDRPQTTRNAIRGIWTTDGWQAVFVDTPGLHKPQTALGTRLNRVVRDTLAEVDVVLFVVDAADGIGTGDAFIAAELAEVRPPVVVALNKVDALAMDEVGRAHAQAMALGPWEVFPVSARTGEGAGALMEAVCGHLPPGPVLYPPEEVTDQPVEVMVAELIREKVLELTREEVPHSVAVVVERIEDVGDDVGEAGATEIDAIVYVERDSQKGIVIGRGGAMLKRIGTRARREIEALLDVHVYLHLHVKVEKDWQRRESLVARFGYGG